MNRQVFELLKDSPEWAHYRSCDLCPRQCGVDRTQGKTGVCGASTQLRLGRAALHWWEEPCLVGNQGSGAVFFSHCALRCCYCQNYDLAHGQGVAIEPDRLAEIFLDLQHKQNAANINLVTPGHYAPHVACALRAVRSQHVNAEDNAANRTTYRVNKTQPNEQLQVKPQVTADCLTIPVVYNTSGYESLAGLSLMQGLVDVYLTDFKYLQSASAQELSSAANYPAAAQVALRAMLDQVGRPVFDTQTGLLTQGVIVRHLVLPGRLEESYQVLRFLRSEYGSDILLSIMGQYTPMHNQQQQTVLMQAGLDRPLSAEEYEQVLLYADKLGFDDYFWQDGQSCGESFIPSFDGQGVVA